MVTREECESNWGTYLGDGVELPGYDEYCRADLTTAGAPVGSPLYGIPDGQVTAIDLNFFVNHWVARSCFANWTSTGCSIGGSCWGTADGDVTAADLQFYVNIWVITFGEPPGSCDTPCGPGSHPSCEWGCTGIPYEPLCVY